HLRQREMLEHELRAAIGSKDIQPYYQPLVDLKTKQVTGFEAVARWHHQELGKIPPSRFIPIAEDTGQIGALTDQLLRSACEVALTWPPHVRLSFNISLVDLKDPTFGLRVLAILSQTQLPPNRLEIEITESAMVHDLETVQQVLGA